MSLPISMKAEPEAIADKMNNRLCADDETFDWHIVDVIEAMTNIRVRYRGDDDLDWTYDFSNRYMFDRICERAAEIIEEKRADFPGITNQAMRVRLGIDPASIVAKDINHLYETMRNHCKWFAANFEVPASDTCTASNSPTSNNNMYFKDEYPDIDGADYECKDDEMSILFIPHKMANEQRQQYMRDLAVMFDTKRENIMCFSLAEFARMDASNIKATIIIMPYGLDYVNDTANDMMVRRLASMLRPGGLVILQMHLREEPYASLQLVREMKIWVLNSMLTTRVNNVDNAGGFDYWLSDGAYRTMRTDKVDKLFIPYGLRVRQTRFVDDGYSKFLFIIA